MPDTAAPDPLSRRDPYYAIVAGLWLAACAVMVVLHWHNLATFAFPDVDDQLRLVEVRDWLNGQAFTDVSQHRMNEPFGAPMHWSRLVDMPIALVIVLLRPLIGGHGAEAVATAIVPLITLGVAMTFTGLIARRLAGRSAGLLATALAGTAITGIIQMQPMRIDHHGWEIALSLIALHAALGPDGRRGGLVAGLALAVGLQISLEVLPFAVALGGALGLHWILAPAAATRRRLVACVASLALAEVALFLIFHRPGQWGVFCDAVSPPHLLGLALAAAGVALTARLDPGAAWARVAGLGVTAVIAAAAFHAVPPGCGLDAFSSLEPIVRTYWYDKIAEGQPIWREDIPTAAGCIGYPVIALACALVAWRQSHSAAWGLYTAMLLAALAVAMLVLRAGALANLVAVPAAAWAALHLLAKAQASRRMLVRVFGSVAILIGLSPWAAGAAGAILAPAKDTPAKPGGKTGDKPCNAIESIRALNALPPARILAPLDFGPAILLETPNAVLASSHHRNHAAMAQEIAAWIGSDDTAHGVVTRRGLSYVVACPAYAELDTYAAAAPHGFAAHMEAGRAPAWLAPVAVPGSRLKVWRVTR